MLRFAFYLTRLRFFCLVGVGDYEMPAAETTKGASSFNMAVGDSVVEKTMKHAMSVPVCASVCIFHCFGLYWLGVFFQDCVCRYCRATTWLTQVNACTMCCYRGVPLEALDLWRNVLCMHSKAWLAAPVLFVRTVTESMIFFQWVQNLGTRRYIQQSACEHGLCLLHRHLVRTLARCCHVQRKRWTS